VQFFLSVFDVAAGRGQTLDRDPDAAGTAMDFVCSTCGERAAAATRSNFTITYDRI
jgi:hypothetical protein